MEKISFEEFKKVDLRVGKVLKAEKVKGSDKLLVFEVDVGEEKRRLVAGLAEYYQPEYFIGKTIVVVVNLEPKKIRGIESQGMVLAAVDEKGKPYLLTVDGEVKPGAKIF
ncbi:MAG: methionine--tRNA ligase subunit beta [Candidatus Hecatellales archaeon]|nr:MAG: methionine--tRNA ligase subunit beta [Candidatus Hecatellales archaeon]